MSSDFRTTFSIAALPHKISYENKVLSIGSCFSQHIAERLQWHKFNVYTNPFGITYNPLSVVSGLERILENKNYTEAELFFQNELWNSFDHHSDFSKTTKEETLACMNESLAASRSYLFEVNTIIITLGTACYYQLKENNKTVNNCHKLAENKFNHVLLPAEEMVFRLSAVIEKIRDINPKATFIFTVSPVRHRNLSAEKNTLSKAHLIIACHELCQRFGYCQYFPAYELMMDDLRDYRFYKADMIHPNETAIDYIFEKFVTASVAENSLHIMKQIAQLKSNLAHRPRNPFSDNHKKFLQQQLLLMNKIAAGNTAINFDAEKSWIEQQLQQLN